MITLSRDDLEGLTFLDLMGDLVPLTGLRVLVGDLVLMGDRVRVGVLAGDNARDDDILCSTSTSPFQ